MVDTAESIKERTESLMKLMDEKIAAYGKLMSQYGILLTMREYDEFFAEQGIPVPPIKKEEAKGH